LVLVETGFSIEAGATARRTGWAEAVRAVVPASSARAARAVRELERFIVCSFRVWSVV
jgi:predicted phosphoribosyltransferase